MGFILVYSVCYWSADNLCWNFFITFDRTVYHTETLLLLLIKTHSSSFSDTQSSLGQFHFILYPDILDISWAFETLHCIPEDKTGEQNDKFLSVLSVRYQCRPTLYKTLIKKWFCAQICRDVSRTVKCFALCWPLLFYCALMSLCSHFAVSHVSLFVYCKMCLELIWHIFNLQQGCA